MIDNIKLKRDQLNDAIASYPRPAAAPLPRRGWARAIREALGMTQTQLAARLAISRQSVQDLENAEADRKITVDSLDRLARALNCRLVYALVPENGSLDDVLERQAQAAADQLLRATDHSMRLEAQGVETLQKERQRQTLVDSLLRGSLRNLWR